MPNLRFRTQDIDLTLSTIITTHKQSPPRRIPTSSRQPEAVTHRQPICRTTPRISRRKDIRIPIPAICGGNRIITPIRQPREGHLHDLEARGGLTVPRSVEGDVHVLRLVVKGVPNGSGVGLEGQSGGNGLAVAGGVVVGGVRGDDEMLPGFETVGEGGRVPN